jgi:acetoacetate decarboxylase
MTVNLNNQSMEAVMGKKGLLKFGQFGMSMPVTDPYVPVPPVWSRHVEQFAINFETDYETAARKIPEPLEFDGDTPTAAVVCNYIDFVTYASSFLEAQLAFNVTYKGKPYLYLSNLFVSSEDALVAGREVYGYPKKMAHMEYYSDKGFYCMTAERPKGVRIFSATARIHNPKVPVSGNPKDTICLKLIPSPVKGEQPQVCQLVGIPITGEILKDSDGLPEFWECDGSVTWSSNSREDPWQDIKINKITSVTFVRLNSILQPGYIVYDYLSGKQEA